MKTQYIEQATSDKLFLNQQRSCSDPIVSVPSYIPNLTKSNFTLLLWKTVEPAWIEFLFCKNNLPFRNCCQWNHQCSCIFDSLCWKILRLRMLFHSADPMVSCFMIENLQATVKLVFSITVLLQQIVNQFLYGCWLMKTSKARSWKSSQYFPE